MVAEDLVEVTGRFRAFLRSSVRQDSWRGASPVLRAVADELHWLLSVTSPVRLKPISDALHIEVQIESADDRPQTMGTLRPVIGGFVATIFSRGVGDGVKALGPRERFTLAHEIGHSLFFANEDAHDLPRRVTPSPIPGSREYRREEGLCDDFAGALLVPRHVLASYPGAPSPEALRSLSGRLEVSLEPLLRRALYDCEMWASWSFILIRASTRKFRFLHGARVPAKARHRLSRELRSAELATMTWAEACAEVEQRIGGKWVNAVLPSAQSAWLMCEP